MSKYKVVGVMSGTSLDGLDLVVCDFEKKGRLWKYRILDGITIPYSGKWRDKLSKAHLLPSSQLLQLHAAYGKYIGESCLKFIAATRPGRVDFISSHGHTVFHQPNSGFTYQLGDGNAIHAISGLPVVFDFRSLDVQLGGQGAPLVPVGDHYLFGGYDVCINIGGIANVSMLEGRNRIAFDICFANMALNHLSEKLGARYDKGGKMAATGVVDIQLLNELRRIYKPLRKKRPSLAREDFENLILPVLERNILPTKDMLATFCESIALEIADALPAGKRPLKVLATGGGALNKYLISAISRNAGHAELVVPDEQTLKFKEALVFAFLGVLRVRGEVNVFKTATGASQDSSAGLSVGFNSK